MLGGGSRFLCALLGQVPCSAGRKTARSFSAVRISRGNIRLNTRTVFGRLLAGRRPMNLASVMKYMTKVFFLPSPREHGLAQLSRRHVVRLSLAGRLFTLRHVTYTLKINLLTQLTSSLRNFPSELNTLLPAGYFSLQRVRKPRDLWSFVIRFDFESYVRFKIRFVVMVRFEIFELSALSIVIRKETIGGG